MLFSLIAGLVIASTGVRTGTGIALVVVLVIAHMLTMEG